LDDYRAYGSRLTHPRYVQLALPEFARESAVRWFQEKKEAAIGYFIHQLEKTPALVAQAEEHLQKLSQLIQSPHAVNGTLSEDDFHLFAALRSLTIVKGLQFPEPVMAYIASLAKQSGVDLYFDRAVG
jgi:glutaredoxin 2